jgi:hypothetical protein
MTKADASGRAALATMRHTRDAEPAKALPLGTGLLGLSS